MDHILALTSLWALNFQRCGTLGFTTGFGYDLSITQNLIASIGGVLSFFFFRIICFFHMILHMFLVCLCVCVWLEFALMQGFFTQKLSWIFQGTFLVQLVMNCDALLIDGGLTSLSPQKRTLQQKGRSNTVKRYNTVFTIRTRVPAPK